MNPPDRPLNDVSKHLHIHDHCNKAQGRGVSNFAFLFALLWRHSSALPFRFWDWAFPESDARPIDSIIAPNKIRRLIGFLAAEVTNRLICFYFRPALMRSPLPSQW